MLKHRFIAMLICVLAFVLLGPAAFAQPAYPEYMNLVRQQANVSDLTALFKRSFTPVEVQQLEGPAALHVGEAGFFTAVANVETASLPLRGQWDFGDGTTAAGLSARHTYDAPGTYTVTFTLSNGDSEDKASMVIRVADREETQALSGRAAPPEQASRSAYPGAVPH